MQQHELEQRYRTLTRIIEGPERMHARRREDMNGSQIGVVVNDDTILWATLPPDPADDEKTAKDLCARARAEVRKQD